MMKRFALALPLLCTLPVAAQDITMTCKDCLDDGAQITLTADISGWGLAVDFVADGRPVGGLGGGGMCHGRPTWSTCFWMLGEAVLEAYDYGPTPDVVELQTQDGRLTLTCDLDDWPSDITWPVAVNCTASGIGVAFDCGGALDSDLALCVGNAYGVAYGGGPSKEGVR